MQRVFLLKSFVRFAKASKLAHEDLLRAAREIERGLVDASLGGGVVKKRVSVRGSSKRDGGRVLVAVRVGERCVFLHGFLKSDRNNISPAELRALKEVAKDLLAASDRQLGVHIESGWLKEVHHHGKKEG